MCGQAECRIAQGFPVGQHTQQAGATPAESMAFTLSAAIQNAQDCVDRGMDPDTFLPRFTFFFALRSSQCALEPWFWTVR